MHLFVDTLDPIGLGGTTTDLMKIRFALGKYKLSVNEIISKSNTDFHTGLFHAGRYIAIFHFNHQFTEGRLTFIDFEVNLNDHFNSFADHLTPQIITGFFKLQQIIKVKDLDKLNSVVLTDEPIFFNPISEN